MLSPCSRITIHLVLRQAGIFNKAQEKANTEIGQEKETTKFVMIAVKADKMTNTEVIDETITAEELNAQIQLGGPKPIEVENIRESNKSNI